eukprot:TRINITY_DN2926_c1_g1_i1.p1 TRINITY_DN2926_c1_g1~~TRINITY_DN2926_c1_g1_i1.p1  ORF type:complete len:452 (-),score=72.65 TRINITY_DN2926_c1_g1_i1:1307-2662(-)
MPNVGHSYSCNVSFPICCQIINYDFEMGYDNHVILFNMAKDIMMVIGMVYVMVRLVLSGHYKHFSVYFRTLIAFLFMGIIIILFDLSPVGKLIEESEIVMLVMYWTVFQLIDGLHLWFTFFMFQSDIETTSILKSVGIALLIRFIITAIGIAIYMVTYDFDLVDLVDGSIHTSLYLTLLVFPWSYCPTTFQPRKAIYPLAIFAGLVYGFGVTGHILEMVHENADCTTLLGDVLNFFFYPMVLYKAVSMDTEYWKQDFLVLANEKDWLFGVSANIDFEKQGLTDFPRIKWDEISIKSVIGHGASSNVYVGRWRETQVAVKKLKVANLDEQEQHLLLKDLISESVLLKSLRHPNIVLFLGIVTESPHLAIITEFLSGGSLFDYIKKIRNKTIPDDLSNDVIFKILNDIAGGMAFLHSHNPPIVHRDLKVRNNKINDNTPPQTTTMNYIDDNIE